MNSNHGNDIARNASLHIKYITCFLTRIQKPLFSIFTLHHPSQHDRRTTRPRKRLLLPTLQSRTRNLRSPIPHLRRLAPLAMHPLQVVQNHRPPPLLLSPLRRRLRLPRIRRLPHLKRNRLPREHHLHLQRSVRLPHYPPVQPHTPI